MPSPEAGAGAVGPDGGAVSGSAVGRARTWRRGLGGMGPAVVVWV